MRHVERVFVGLIALSVAACGSGGSDESNAASGAQSSGANASASAQRTDPCSLVTAEDVGAVLGDKIVTTRPGEGSCVYETADAQAASVTIELNQRDAAGQMDVARTAAGMLKDMGAQAAQEGAAGQDVNAMLSESGGTPRIGDEAFFGPNSQLSVRKGISYLSVQPPIMRSRMGSGNPMLSSEDRKKIALAVAEKALSRLP